MLRGGGPFFAEVHKAIIDASVVDFGFSNREDRSFRGDCDAGFFDQPVIGITENLELGQAEVLLMFADLGGCMVTVRIDQNETNVARGEFIAETLDFGRVPIGDGTINAQEEENQRIITDERIDSLAIEIDGDGCYLRATAGELIS